MFTDVMLRLRALFTRAAVERDIDEELQFHLEQQVASYVARGVPRDEAVRLARLELGGVAQVKEAYRDALGVRVFENVSRDLRLAIRTLRRTPVVTAVAILSLALGIGANTAIFSLIDSLLVRTLPVRDPHHLAFVGTTEVSASAWNYPVWNELRQQPLFENVAAWSPSRFDLSLRGETQFVDGLWTSGTFFDTLGVTASMGRTFSSADDQRGGGPDGPVAVISHRFWQRHFGGAPDVVGRTLPLHKKAFTIVGVTPPEFFGLEVGRTFDVAVPLELNDGPRGPRVSWLRIVGRLKAGDTLAAATARLETLQPRIRETTLPPNANEAFRAWYLQESFELASAATGRSDLRRQYEQPLLAIMIVVALVMLVACANIANLLLARAAARRHEFSVRLALGASRSRLASQVLAESVVLAAIGALLGLLVAAWGGRLLVRELGNQPTIQATAVFLDLTLNWRVLAFTIASAVATALLFGLAPAFRAARATPDALKEGRVVGGSRAGVSSGLVVAQLTLSVVLIVAAGLFVRTFASLTSRPLGFEPERVLVVSVSAGRAVEPADRIPTFERAVTAVRSLPNVTGVAASLVTPLSGLALENQIEVPGVPPPPSDGRGALVNHVSPGWFHTLGSSLVAGRDFTDADGPSSAPVAIVNEAFARRFLDGRNPVGYALKGLPVGRPSIPIIGMTADAVYKSMRDPAPPTIYLPFAQSREVAAFASMSLIIRASGDSPMALTRSVTSALQTVNPDLTWTFRPLANQIDAAITQERITAMLAGFFGVLALILAALGLYGVTTYTVSRRRPEIAIRLALGASSGQVVQLVLSRVAVLVGLGAAAGIAVSLWLSQFVATLLYGLEPRDPLTLITAALVLAAVGLAAGSLPAIRASRIHPAAVLRET